MPTNMEMAELEETQKGVHRRSRWKDKRARTHTRQREGTGGEEGLVFHFFPRARRTKAIVEDPIVED